jgi:tRNA nucleotidyltransferase/poly(A) polymerase
MTGPSQLPTEADAGSKEQDLQSRFPREVLDAINALGSTNQSALLIGECVHEAACGMLPLHFQTQSPLTPTEVLRRFPLAVPTAPEHKRFAIPTAAGPLDVFPLPATASLESGLRSRSFSIHSMAYDPRHAYLHDPHEGMTDTRERVLRGVADPTQRFTQMPLEALRAAGLLARFRYQPHPNLLPGFQAAIAGLAKVRRADLRRSLLALLDLTKPGRAIKILHATGIEKSLFPGACSDSGPIMNQLPRDRWLRLAIWLRGTAVQKHLQQLAVSRPVANRVQQLLRHHPIDRAAPSRNLWRLSGDERAQLFHLRRAELDQSAEESGPREQSRQHLHQLEKTLEEKAHEFQRERSRNKLALDGSAVMEILDCPAGKRVGEALRFLSDYVSLHPEQNAADPLRAQLEQWDGQHPA